MTISEINSAIQSADVDKNQISDGYHTFGELYEARCLLFVALIQAYPAQSWRADKNADGQKWAGWFVCGINPTPGKQITFHLPEKYWPNLDGIETHDVNPYFDGHNAQDVRDRLNNVILP